MKCNEIISTTISYMCMELINICTTKYLEALEWLRNYDNHVKFWYENQHRGQGNGTKTEI